MKRKIVILVLIVIAIVLGFFRDYVFVSINTRIESGNAGGKLMLFKWALTFIFSLLYFSITAGLLHFLFHSKTYIIVAGAIYLFLFSVSLLVVIVGWMFASFETFYSFTRTIMGIVQSPIILMILIPCCYLDKLLRSPSIRKK